MQIIYLKPNFFISFLQDMFKLISLMHEDNFTDWFSKKITKILSAKVYFLPAKLNDLKYLQGICEQVNSKKGYSIPIEKLIFLISWQKYISILKEQILKAKEICVWAKTSFVNILYYDLWDQVELLGYFSFHSEQFYSNCFRCSLNFNIDKVHGFN